MPEKQNLTNTNHNENRRRFDFISNFFISSIFIYRFRVFFSQIRYMLYAFFFHFRFVVVNTFSDSKVNYLLLLLLLFIIIIMKMENSIFGT